MIWYRKWSYIVFNPTKMLGILWFQPWEKPSEKWRVGISRLKTQSNWVPSDGLGMSWGCPGAPGWFSSCLSPPAKKGRKRRKRSTRDKRPARAPTCHSWKGVLTGVGVENPKWWLCPTKMLCVAKNSDGKMGYGFESGVQRRIEISTTRGYHWYHLQTSSDSGVANLGEWDVHLCSIYGLTSTGSETLIAESKNSCNFKLKAGRGGEAMNLELLASDFCGQLAESLMIHGEPWGGR